MKINILSVALAAFGTLVFANDSSVCPDSEKDEDDFFRFSGPLNETVLLEFGDDQDEPLDRFDPYRLYITFPSSCESGAANLIDESGCKILLFQPPVVNQGFRMMEVDKYDEFFGQLASHGLIVVGVDADIGSQDPTNYAEQLEPVFEYVLSSEFEEDMNAAGVEGSIDNEKIIIGGHGNGARAMLERVTASECEGGSIGGMVMIDPLQDVPQDVDIFASFESYIPEDSRENLPLVMPALHITNALADEISEASNEPCAESSETNLFFSRWRGPIFHSEAVNFGHIDVADVRSTFNEETICNVEGFQDIEQSDKDCLRQSHAALILHFFNYLFFDSLESNEVLDPDAIATAEEELNEVDYTRDVRNINLQDNGFFPSTEPFCRFDPDLLSPLVRIVLITGAAFTGLICCGVCCYFRGYRKTMKQQEEEMKKNILNAKKAKVVPGMGYTAEEADAIMETREVKAEMEELQTGEASVVAETDRFPRPRTRLDNEEEEEEEKQVDEFPDASQVKRPDSIKYNSEAPEF